MILNFDHIAHAIETNYKNINHGEAVLLNIDSYKISLNRKIKLQRNFLALKINNSNLRKNFKIILKFELNEKG